MLIFFQLWQLFPIAVLHSYLQLLHQYLQAVPLNAPAVVVHHHQPVQQQYYVTWSLSLVYQLQHYNLTNHQTQCQDLSAFQSTIFHHQSTVLWSGTRTWPVIGGVTGSWTAVLGVLPVTNVQSQLIHQSVFPSLLLPEQLHVQSALVRLDLEY